MGNLYLMTTILERKNAKNYDNLFQGNNLHVIFWTLGFGTVSSEIRDYLGLETSEKAVAFSVLEEDLSALEEGLFSDFTADFLSAFSSVLFGSAAGFLSAFSFFSSSADEVEGWSVGCGVCTTTGIGLACLLKSRRVQMT